MNENVFGWNSMDELSKDVWYGPHSILLYGDFRFAVRQGGYQIIISKRKDRQNAYIVGVITPTWTSLYPSMPFEQLSTQILDEMKTFKFNKDIINSFNNLLSNNL